MAADAVHQLIDEVTVALVEPFGLSEQAVDNRHRLLDPFRVNDQAARLSDSVEQTAEPQRLGAALFEHGRDHVVADGYGPGLMVNKPAVEHQPPLQYLTLSGDNGGSQPALGVNTQIAEGMAWSNRQNAMTSKAKPVPGAWMLAWNQGF